MRSINDGVIKRSIFTVGDTAVIKLPLSAYMRNTEGVLQRVQTSEKFKVGDPVTIRLGYDGKLRTEFVGFVRRLNLKMPLEIECEDWTYPLRTINIKKSWKKASIKEILQFIAKEAGFKLLDGIPEWSITNFIANNVTALWVLNELKDKYGLTIYFTQDNKLYAGLAYVRNTGDVKMVIGRNIIKADDLKYMNADDVKLKIKAISMERNGSKIEAEIGDKDGEIRTLYFYDVRDKSHLEQLAKSEIGKYKYNGYRGVVNCFLRPYVEPSMTSVLSDPLFPERSGSYFVETTEVNFGVQGARRKVSLGIKLTK
jgi:hypothetical protein